MTDTLQEMILHCRAEGDEETAAWLASIADDPEQVATVTGEADDATDFAVDAKGHEHKGKGKGGGQFTKKGDGSGNGPTSGSKKGDNKGTATPAKSKRTKVPKQLTPEEHAALIAKAKAKFKETVKPTKEELNEAKSGLERLGANKYRKNLVGNSTDRAKRRKKLYEEFGDGKSCSCIYCGIKVGEGTLEQDKLYTTAEGGRYRTNNLIPSCSDCNKVRSDTPFDEFIKGIKPNGTS